MDVLTEAQVGQALEAKFKEVTDQLADAQKNNASKEEILAIHASIKTQGEAFDAYVDANKQKVIQTELGQFKSFLNENKEELNRIAKAKAGEIMFTPKVVGDITTESGIDIDTPPLTVSTTLGHFNFRNDNSLLSLASVTSTSSPAFSYTEMLPKDGDYAFVAEGAVKPQIDFTWENRYESPKKIAAYEILTEEAVTDYARMMSVAKEYLTKKHDLFKVNAIFFGTGLLENPTGATVYGRTFVATGMADAFPAGTSNFMDVVNASITDIFRTRSYPEQMPYMPNLVLMNPIDFFLKLVGAKDANGLPLYPQAGLFNQVKIGGVTIKPWIQIPPGKIFVADMKNYHIANYVPFSIRIGWINDQFITNKFTMVGESRFFQYVKNLDQAAFIYDDIATIQAAITGV